MEKYNYIFLKDKNNDYFLKHIKNRNIKKYYIFHPKSKMFKILRKCKIDSKKLWGDWKKDIDKYDLVILGENNYSFHISKYIKQKNKHCRIIVYYWNVLNEGYKKILKDPNVDEFWSFDKNEVKKYNLKYNTQFYSWDCKLPKKEVIQDVCFCGRDKGREKILKEINDNFIANNLKTNIYICKNEKDFVPYDKYLEEVAKSKAVLDVNANHQIGLSLRPMESIFFEKKLITTNEDIANYDFYRKENVFIIGKDDYKDLPKFLNTPYKKIPKKIVDYYDYHNWIKRFFE